MGSRNDSRNNKHTQRGRLFQLLKARTGEWVPAYEVAAIALQYNTRLHELRAAGAVISNRREYHNGQTLSWFRLEPTPASARVSAPKHSELLFDLGGGRHRDDG